jgi:hypothetical protein
MRVVVDGRAKLPWGAAEERKITLARDCDAAEGAILAADEALAAVERRLKTLYVVLAIVVAVVFVGAGFVADASDLWFILPATAVLTLLLAAFMVFTFRRQSRKARADSDEYRLGYAPPPGSAVRADAHGLTIGGRMIPWTKLSIAEVDIVTHSIGEDSNEKLIARLSLTGPAGAITLFAGGMKNGRAIVDKAWRELRKS